MSFKLKISSTYLCVSLRDIKVPNQGWVAILSCNRIRDIWWRWSRPATNISIRLLWSFIFWQIQRVINRLFSLPLTYNSQATIHRFLATRQCCTKSYSFQISQRVDINLVQSFLELHNMLKCASRRRFLSRSQYLSTVTLIKAVWKSFSCNSIIFGFWESVRL